ncbi:GNAT family N-acetyltransferase [uncultured Arthrobacter sp.]|uniref:GNAT family N-acetyltransferase n=1 Tax=uncultured Arthrobacter sp. TaxID=114050 RepID=UPI0025DD5683|nr:GNAT family N-acetyltransferase [uncultured Arthrobacter sp.]
MSTQTTTPGTSTELRLEKFQVTAEEDTSPGGRFANWFYAVGVGFFEPRANAEDYPEYVKAFAADARTLIGVHDDAPGALSVDGAVPVATYASMRNTLNAGGPKPIQAHLITSVTVRPTHRRRGLLRRMMTGDLQAAAAAGVPVAVLTASEATIYGRFGFGCATFTTSVTVDVRERFAVLGTPTGRTELAKPAEVPALAGAVFAQFHRRTRGSVGRQYSYARRVSGQWGRERPVEDKAVRTAVHYDDAGNAVGYVAYRFEGWSKEPYTVRIIDLVAGTEEAYLGLWRYLGSLDLIQEVTWDGAAVDDPLPWALADRRCYRVNGVDDVLWVRLLDVAKALEGRGYRTEGELVIEVTDAQGMAGGTFEFAVADGRARVEQVSPNMEADVVLDIAALGSLYLGGVSPAALVGAGLIEPRTEGVVEFLNDLFRDAQDPYCITHF